MPPEPMFLSIRARSFAACLATASLFAPPVAAAAPVDAKALADFEAGFDAGQRKFDAGEHIDAARTWVSAANNLKESASNKDNRQAVYEYIADAWTRGLAGSEDVALLREAEGSLSSYCEGFTIAYGTETPILPKIVETRDELRRRLKEAETKPPPVVEGPGEAPPGEGPVEPSGDGPRWKGLAIGGGVALGLGVGFVVMGAVGGVRGQKVEKDFTAMDCIDNPMGDCSRLEKRGKTMNALAISGGVVGGLLVVTGAVLLAIGLKRKASRKQALVPMLSPTFAGLSLRGSF